MSPSPTVPAPPSPLKQKHSQHSFHGDAEQSGRSSTGLNAQKSSASLSQARPHRSADSSPRHSTQHHRNTSEPVASPVRTAGNGAKRPQAFPLQDTSSAGTSSSSSAEEQTPESTGKAAPNNASLAQAIAGAANLPPPPRIPAARGDLSSRTSWTSMTRGNTPRSVRDLGSDYSRYYNPFSSLNNSTTDLNLLSPSNKSSSNLTLPLLAHQERRPSNPFVDDRKPARSPSDGKQEEERDKVRDAKGSPPVVAGVVFTGLPIAKAAGTNVDPEKSFFPYLDDRLGAPTADAAGYNFPMLWDEKEDDDDMHMPMVDDDVRLKPSFKERFTRENIVSTFGFLFMCLGLFCIFIILPVVSSTGVNLIHYVGQDPLSDFPGHEPMPAWKKVNDRKYPLIKNIRAGLIDPDTPQSAKTKKSLVDGETLNLVFSDEFNAQNRSFWQGDDPYFTAANFWYGATQDLEWYDPDAVNTYNGVLELQLDKFPNHGLAFRSGMLNSWNQLCFKGGIWEVSVSLPGPAGVHGLWPGVWSMGNLGRPGHLATTDGLWPYTYDECDSGITPNQSMTDGTSKLPGQKLNSCTCRGEDHPNPGRGRGAPEIDIVEAAADYGQMGWGTATQSFQVAPFDVWYYPNYDFFETPRYEHSVVNTYTGGPYQEAVSVTTVLNNSWFDGNAYQRYSYDYAPGGDENAHVAFVVADEIQGMFDGRALGPNGNVKQRLISEEPMSMVMNLGMSNSWTTVNFEKLVFPTVMRIDYVRLYQREGQESVTCDPPGYPTTQYIARHPEAYQNPNYTKWSDIPGYTWPKNELMHGCSA